MNSYQQHTAPSQQTQAQYPLRPPSSQQHLSFQQPINPQINVSQSNHLPMNPNLHSSINPGYLAAFQNAQHSAMNGMIPKFPSVYPSYQQQPHQSLNQSHPQMQTIASSQLHHSQQTPTQQPQSQSAISPTQLLSASPSQLIAGHASQQLPSQSLTLTPAQLLQQQQSASMNHAAIAGTPSMNLGGVNPNMSSLGGMPGLGINMAGMNNMQSVQSMGNVNNMGMSTAMGMQAMPHMSGAPNQAQNSAMRMSFPPGMNPMRYSQMTPQERAAFQRQQQAANLGHHMPTERPAAPSTPGQPAPHERGPSLTHERPPSQHGRAMSDRQSSQQPHDRAQSQPRDMSALQGDRPSSSASVRSHHSHPPHDGIMPPPGSRPGTATGTMSQTPTRMNLNQHAMNLNPNMNAVQLTPGMGGSNMSMNMNMATHMAHGPNLNPVMNQAPQMNMGVANVNPQMNPGAGMQMGAVGGGGMGMPMNRPPTRTGSALGLGSPKQSPRMSMGPMGGAPGVGVGPSVGMGGMGAGVQGNMSSNMGGGMGPMSGGMGAHMSGGNMGPMGGPMNGSIGIGMGPQSMSTVPGMTGMVNMGPMGMNSLTQGLGAGGTMMGGAGGGLMGPPVIPQTLQRPSQEQIMQSHMRDQPAPGPRETSLPPTSASPFMGLDSANVSNMGSSMPGLQPQGTQPPPQQSPVRQLQPPHHSPMPSMRKPGEIPGPTATPPVNVPPIPGTTPGQKLPPHLASLNPAVTKISYIPYAVPKSTEAAEEASDEDKKPSDESTADVDKDKDKDKEDAAEGESDSKPPSDIKIEDPLALLSAADIVTLKAVMARDSAYETVYRAKQARVMQEMRSAGPGARLAWWDRDFAAANGLGAGMGGAMGMARRQERFDVRYPRPMRGEQMGMKKKGARREGIRIPGKLPAELANRPEQLVPIRLEFDMEHHKMRETFVWNLNDPVITPEMFAQTLVEDYALAPSYHSVITKSIQEQLSDFKTHIASFEADWKPPNEIPQSEGVGGDDAEDSDVEVVRQTQQPVSQATMTMEEGKQGSGRGDVDGDGDKEKNMDGTMDREDLIVRRGTLDEEAIQWWESWRKRAKKEMPTRSAITSGRRKKRKINVRIQELEDSSTGGNVQERPRTVDEFDMDEKKIREDLRILIKLDIIVGSMKLDDQFEWDLENQDASPEQFAEVYAKELGLGGEFKTAIAHCIREQVQVYQKSLFLVGHPSDGSLVQDDDLRMSFLPSLTSATRAMDQVQSFTPLLNYLSDGEIERNEKEREKELTKRRKRNTRGRRGIALPDREPNRTYRTPAIGFPELDPATLALAAAANAPTSRRAAAAAASLTIANMVASENGTSIMPLQLPPQQSTSQVTLMLNKEKKPKGLFKPPDYPPTVLRPRAKVTAPTPSTAVASVSMLPSSLLESDPPVTVVTPAPPDSKALAKKARESEREAKEKEFADGQHANVINGVWHCSNCGCPESIAIGRRKGPLGDKSQCGTCGKFWHRHRRPRPVQYNSDPQYHLNLKNEELGKTTAKKRGRAANSVAVDGAETPSQQKSELWVEAPNRPPNSSTIPPSEDDRPVSPVSTASSASEAPLALQVFKTNGTNSLRPSTPESPRQQLNVSSSSPGAGEHAPHSNGSFSIPAWLSAAILALQTKYPDDRFEAILRKPSPKAPPEWRIKCLDCPGKLYNPGPGDSLSNYEVHLKNRQHRMKVTTRAKGSS